MPGDRKGSTTVAGQRASDDILPNVETIDRAVIPGDDGLLPLQGPPGLGNAGIMLPIRAGHSRPGLVGQQQTFLM